MDVGINIDLGDQTPAALALLVDGEVVAQQSFVAGPPAMQAEAEGDAPAEQAPIVITLSFDSDSYDETTGTPTYMNGDHSIRAVFDVVGSMEHILSNEQVVEFDNTDGVHVDGGITGQQRGESEDRGDLVRRTRRQHLQHHGRSGHVLGRCRRRIGGDPKLLQGLIL